LTVVLLLGFSAPCRAWDWRKPFIYEYRIAVEMDNWLNAYSTSTVLSKSDNTVAFRVVANSTVTPTYQLIVTTQGNVGISTGLPRARLEIQGSPSAVYTIVVGTSAVYQFVISTGGLVGIATSAPMAQLAVAGDIASTKWMTSGCVNPNDPNDAMVAVGDLCVDKYEATIWSTPTGGTPYGAGSDDYICNDNGQDCGAGAAHPIYARSVSGYTPSRYMTWFQASAACNNSGKHLLTNAEWQWAARGTSDPGGGVSAPNCNTLTTASGPHNTGAGYNCVSSCGAQDMIGNLWEWVADWGTAGADSSNSYGTGVEWDGSVSGYNNDGMWNVGGKAYTHYNSMGWTAGMVPALLRGGAWAHGAAAGVFAFTASNGPSFWNDDVGFRCGRSR